MTWDQMLGLRGVDFARTLGGMADIHAWYAAHEVSGLTPGSAAPTVYDLTGNGFNLARHSDAAITDDPTWETASGPNGLAYFKFNGTDQAYQAAFASDTTLPNTRVMVMRASANKTQCFMSNATSSAKRQSLFEWSTGHWYPFSGIGLDTGEDVDTSWHIVFVEYIDGATNIYVDGVLIGTGDTDADDCDGISLGCTYTGTFPASYELAEFVMVDGLVSSEIRGKMTTLLGVKYAISAVMAFALIVLPDTQLYSQDIPATFDAQTQWVVDNEAAHNIRFLSHVGDVVQNGGDLITENADEWTEADDAMAILDDNAPNLPYAVCLGNHDWGDPTPYEDGQTTNPGQFKRNFGAARYSGKTWFLGADATDRNFYQQFNALGRRFIHICLEMQDPDELVAATTWMNGIIDSYPNNPVILTTHFYLHWTDIDNPAGTRLWTHLKSRDQVFLVLCGHVWDSDGATVSTRSDALYIARQMDSGEYLHEVRANYQGRTSAGTNTDGQGPGDGSLRIMKFNEKSIEVSTYSPTVDYFQTDASNHFTIPIDFSKRFPL